MRAFAAPAAMVLGAEGPIEGIRAAVGWLASVSGEDSSLPVVAESTVRALRDPELGAAIAGGLALFREELGKRLAAAVGEGSTVRHIDPDGLAVVITALVDGLLIHRLLDPELDLDAALRALTAMLAPSEQGP